MDKKIEETREFLQNKKDAESTASGYMLLCYFGNGRHKTRYVME